MIQNVLISLNILTIFLQAEDGVFPFFAISYLMEEICVIVPLQQPV
jgi:hypothetical protein